MKYGRGRVIAVALLSTVLALLLSGFGFLVGFARLQTNADSGLYDPNHIPTFDESYTFEPITTSGQVVLGQNNTKNATFALRDESFNRDALTTLFNATQKQGFSTLKRTRDPYALFTDADMQSIVNGTTMNDYGVLFDDANGDGIFDYTDRNGNGQFDVGEDDGLDKYVANCLQTPVIMLDTTSVDQVVVFELLNLPQPPKATMTRDGNALPVKEIVLQAGQDADYVYGGWHNPNTGATDWETHEEIGAVASCTTGSYCSLRGVFNQEGFYEFAFEIAVPGANGTLKTSELNFSFYIVNRSHYTTFPSFPAANRASGDGNVYNYSFGGAYPTVSYSPNYFDVTISGTEEPNVSDELSGNKLLQFYAIGEYTMTSYLKHRSFDKVSGKYHELRLQRYRPNVSVLNVRGFQAYYGGQHQNADLNGPLPFYDTTDSSINSNITPWITDNDHALNITNKNPDVSATMAYAKRLTTILDNHQADLVPLRTNFPPVKFVGNVNHAAGTGIDGHMTRLSTVSFQGVADPTWNEPRTFEPGEAFTDAGRYLVVLYFWVNTALCQQTFYFEISNALDLQFAVANSNGTQTIEYDPIKWGELVRDKKLQGREVTIMYNGVPQLGQFEVQPSVTLERATLNDARHYTDITNEIKIGADGSFNFRLDPACYRLNVTYGAYGQSTTVIEIVVDNTPASNIKTTSSFQQTGIAGLPENTAIWGAANVALSWDPKPSGIGYHNVTVDYYRTLIQNSLADPNASINNADYDSKNTNLFSPTVFAESLTSSNAYTPVWQDERWTLSETFNQAGLYKITLEDEVGNQTTYLLIIDNSTSAFVQDSTEPKNPANIVCLDGKDSVRVGFGRNKLVEALSAALFDATDETWPQFAALRESKVIVTEGSKDALAVPIGKVELSVNGGTYTALGRAEMEQGYLTLYEDDNYYFRVTDVLGNVSMYYIILTNDHSLGMVYAETGEQAFNSDRGFIENDANLNTSLVNTKGGMTNRNYLSFVFTQIPSTTSLFRVRSVRMEYYPFTTDTTSRNYPFAANPVNYLKRQTNDGGIYQSDTEDKDNIRIALYNKGEPTRRGLYIITRTYHADSGVDSGPRYYYFIVDDQPMLYYDKNYQSDLRIRFGSDDKIASAADFEYFRYELRSNRAAEIAGFESKYHGTTRYLGYEFPSLIPRFSYINNGQTTNLGEGSIYEILGDQPTGDINYKLVVADNACDFPVLISNGSIVEMIPAGKLTSANYSELSLVLDTGYGTRATLIKNNRYDTPITTTQLEYEADTCVYTYVLDPKGLTALTFEFESDSRGFYADIAFYNDHDRSLLFTGFERTAIIRPMPVDNNTTTCRYDIAGTFLSGTSISSGDMIAVTLTTKDNQQTTYNILFDLDDGEPTYNLQRIINQDNLAKDLPEIPDKYIYGLSTEFAFAADQSQNRYLDTKEISYREVSYQGEGSLTKTTFRLNSGRAFADIVGLRDNEMKYYYITETDYAGHVYDYIVQIQGEKYNGDITYVGAIPGKSTDDNTILGVEMHVSTASAHQFYLNNNSFKFVNGDEYYAVYCGTAQWYLHGEAGTGSSSEGELVTVLNQWINEATERGERCYYVLYDRMGDPETFACYNIREDATTLQMEAYNQIPDSPVASPVILQTINYDSLPKILKDPVLAEFYQIEVIDVATQRPLDNITFTLGQMTLYNISKNQELIIRVTDPFDRVSITEYHGQDEIGLRFVPYGNTVEIDGVTYVGDSRGVQFSFLRTVYSINVYNADTGAVITNLSTFVQGDRVTYTFTPSALRADTTRYRIEAVGRSSHAVLYEKTFGFDTRLPQVIWTNTSDQQIAVNNNTFTGTVNMRVVPDDMLRFGATVTYRRTVNGSVEQVTLPAGTETFQFDQIGDYVVTLRSRIWATTTYTFKIANISDAVISVYDDDNLLTPSASLYTYQGKVISNYIFTMETRLNDDGENELLDLTYYDFHGLRMVPAESGNRQLVWYSENQAYQYYDRQNNTLVWRFAVATGVNEFGNTIYASDLYLATTGVPRGSLNTDSKISLILNNDTLSPNYVSHQVLTADNKIFTENNNTITVRLSGSSTPDSATNNFVPCFTYQGNLLLVDCYRNGELVKTLSYDESFELTAADAGYYQFRVRDLVGNTLQFGGSKDYYALVVLTKPMVVINDANPVKHMVYNDRVEFKIIDDADALLREEYGEAFFNQYFKIASLEVTCNSTPVTVNLTDNPTSFVWTQKGTYLVKLTYQIGENLQQTIADQYEFEIIPSFTAMTSWSMTVYNDIQILSVRRNGYLLRDFTEPAVGDALRFSADGEVGSYGTGSYQIVLQSYDKINGYKTHTINFNIDYKNSYSLNYFWIDTASGLATTSPVTLSYQAKLLYYARGDCTVYVYKDFSVVESQDVNASTVLNMDFNDLSTIKVSDVGLYTVQVFDAEGDLVYADSWTIEATKSSVGYIITAVVAGIAGIGLIIFIRLRRKMKVK